MKDASAPATTRHSPAEDSHAQAISVATDGYSSHVLPSNNRPPSAAARHARADRGHSSDRGTGEQLDRIAGRVVEHDLACLHTRGRIHQACLICLGPVFTYQA